MLTFNHNEMAKELDSLPPNVRPLFAGLVSERFFSQVETFFRERDLAMLSSLRASLEEIWQYGVKGWSDKDVRSQLLEKCMAAIQCAADAETEAGFFAENAAAAIAYGLRSIDAGDPKEAAWAGQAAYDNVDRFVLIKEQNMNANWSEVEILENPVIQREFRRQLKDIESLRRLSKDSNLLADVIWQLRQNARLESESVFSEE